MNSMRANASATSYWTILILVITTRPVATVSSHSAMTTSFGTLRLSKLLNSTKTSLRSVLEKILLNLAKNCLAQARKDNDDLQVDYKFQHHALLQKHWRKPTRKELIVAHHLRYNKQQPSMEDGDDEDGDDEDEGSQNAVNDEDDDKLDSDGGDPLPELNYDFDLPVPEASSQPEPSLQPRPAAATSRKGKAS
ncbi:hypothetical protein D6C84_09942 [Aureobasidium pullulans]|uniref:Uncharacterized protein n=1 Tax=Aureobasidium pullulans TaxID=5580 RepID=A0A4S9X2C4_AURPU|nr:hypothetical protein D6C84_09942 [Aureobasidium pullulans]